MTEPTASVHLVGTATREVVNDVLRISLVASAIGQSAAAVQEELRVAVQAALHVVRPSARDEEVQVSTGSFSVSPRYDKEQDVVGHVGHVGHAVLCIEGTDVVTISALASEVTTMVVQSSENATSRRLRESLEAELIAEAISNFRGRAQAISAQFGYASYALGNVSVSVNMDNYGMRASQIQIGSALSAHSGVAQSVESGRSSLVATVQGSIVPIAGKGSVDKNAVVSMVPKKT